MNGMFQIVNDDGGCSLRVTYSTSGQSPDRKEIINYLNYHKVDYDIRSIGMIDEIGSGEMEVNLNGKLSYPIREEVITTVSSDKMLCVGRFYPPSSDGEHLTMEEIINDLKSRGVISGIDYSNINDFLTNKKYCEDIVLAKGEKPSDGSDARIEYYFNTDKKARPAENQDGSVDFFNLNIINHCAEGEVLARLIPANRGNFGRDICNNIIKPKEVKTEVIKYGINVELSDDKTELRSLVNGHVELIDGRVFVSQLMTVKDVDSSTGNIEYEGSILVEGNVISNYKIKAKGNVEVRGYVEGAYIEAGGNIIIARGINGVGKGMLKAGGNVITLFIENAEVYADGYVESNSILRGNVYSNTEIRVLGKKGSITGGYTCATNKVEVNTLGSDMGTSTVVEVGVSPSIKMEYNRLKEEISEAINSLKMEEPVLLAVSQKLKDGVKFSKEQIKNIQSLSESIRIKKELIDNNQIKIYDMDDKINSAVGASVVVYKVVNPGVKIIIDDLSKIVKSGYKYCRFIKSEGEVSMVGL